MALFEDTVSDQTGRIVNASFGDYLIAVNADVPDIDVVFVGGPDPMTPTGTKGIAETGNHRHGCGYRKRCLPRDGDVDPLSTITIEKGLGA
jgi:hypothetical protein